MDMGRIDGCVGIFYDYDARWIEGYNIGVCDVLHVEMWGALFGLRHDLKRAFFSSYSGK
jgi:hypothetical protein